MAIPDGLIVLSKYCKVHFFLPRDSLEIGGEIPPKYWDSVGVCNEKLGTGGRSVVFVGAVEVDGDGDCGDLAGR